MLWALNSSEAMFYNKKRSTGIAERLDLLSRIYPISRDIYDYALNEYSRKEVARDDILDALVGAVTGLLGRDKLVTIPEKPDLGYQGLPMEMVYCVPT
jgi:predicted RNase H-like nuclease